MSRFNLGSQTGRYFAIALVLIVVLLGMRLVHLDADPPLDLSGSTDVYTDPPQYTLFARLFVQDGAFNPYNDQRLPFFLKSTVTALATVVFTIGGVSLWTSNLVGLLFAFGSLLLVFVVMVRIGGWPAAIVYLLFAGLNYNLLFYGRLPFLEHAMTFWPLLGFTILIYGRSNFAHFLAGACLGIGIFFGKIIGVVFLFPFVCLLLYGFLFGERRKRWTPVIWFTVGALIITAAWFFFSYLPTQRQVTGYIGEQAVSLYGAPEGLESIDSFFRKMASFGYISHLFPRMAIVSLLAVGFLSIVFFRAGHIKRWFHEDTTAAAGCIFIAAMIVGFFGSLMIWNYRPLRYQLVLIYPFCAAAALLVRWLWGALKSDGNGPQPWLFYVIFWPVLYVMLHQAMRGLESDLGFTYVYEDTKLSIGLFTTALLIGFAFTWRSISRLSPPYLLPVRRGLLVGLVALSTIFAVADWHYWFQRPTWQARQQGRDLGKAIAPDAILSGPYGPLLTLESGHDAIIHMFGVSQPDPELFKRFPITHLLLDRANERRARADYGALMDSSYHLYTYHVGTRPVRLFSIFEQTGHPRADAYQPSILEQAYLAGIRDSIDLSNALAVKYVQDYPDNITGNMLLAERAALAGHSREAGLLFKKAVEFAPANYDLNARLAEFLADQYDKTGLPEYRSAALKYYDTAIRLAPTLSAIRDARRELTEK